MFEVVIRGKFVTGTTSDDEEIAKKQCEELLVKRLEEAGCAGPVGLFTFKVESVEAERL